jgi:lysophospholipase L1-like esterase
LLFRLAAIALGLLPVLAIEGTLRLFDLGRPADYEDPFVGFSAVHPLFVPDATGTNYEIPRSRQVFFCPESFPIHKPAGCRRVFVLGGSTVQGRPYAKETAFSTWLEIRLNAADPDHSWDVINCGGISYASYRLIPILREVLTHQPDLIVVCTGHNEFLEDRTYGEIRQAPAWRIGALEVASRSRVFTLLRHGWLRLRGREALVPEDRPVLGPEVVARLDYKGGIDAYLRDDAWHRDVIEHFEANLRGMVRTARAAGVPLILVSPVSNLEYPPLKAEPTPNLTPEESLAARSLRETARQRFSQDLPGAIERLEQAVAIDPRHAGLLYDLGRCHQLAGRWTDARQALIRARDEDVCPLRMPSPIRDRLLQLAEVSRTPLVDADRLIAERSRGGIPGAEWLVDHVHPSIEGHRLIADALANEVIRHGLIRPRPRWRDDLERRDRDHLASLDPSYFLKARIRLSNEQGWARGQAQLEPPSGSPPISSPDDSKNPAR